MRSGKMKILKNRQRVITKIELENQPWGVQHPSKWNPRKKKIEKMKGRKLSNK